MKYVVGLHVQQIYLWGRSRGISPNDLMARTNEYRIMPMTQPQLYRGWRLRENDVLIKLEEYEWSPSHEAREYLRLIEDQAEWENVKYERKFHHTQPRIPSDWDCGYIAPVMDDDPWATVNRKPEPQPAISMDGELWSTVLKLAPKIS